MEDTKGTKSIEDLKEEVAEEEKKARKKPVKDPKKPTKVKYPDGKETELPAKQVENIMAYQEKYKTKKPKAIIKV